MFYLVRLVKRRESIRLFRIDVIYVALYFTYR